MAGINFFLISRAEANIDFNGLVGLIASKTREPLVAVFPEGVFGRKPIQRRIVKQRFRDALPILRRHGNAWLFLSASEAGLRPTSKGYIVGPIEYRKGTNWKEYPKVTTGLGDYIDLYKYGRDDIDVAHWKRRAGKVMRRAERAEGTPGKNSFGFFFPKIKVAGKTLELRICSDAILPSANKAHFIVVPAEGLPKREQGMHFETLGQKQVSIIHNTRKGSLIVDTSGGIKPSASRGSIRGPLKKPPRKRFLPGLLGSFPRIPRRRIPGK